jgi:hypothetical protein
MPQPALLLRAASILGLAFGAPAAGHAQERPCAARSQVVERLAARFGETLRSLGMQSAEGLVEVYASTATGAWTILLTSPDGTSRLMAAGDAWESLAPRPGKDA